MHSWADLVPKLLLKQHKNCSESSRKSNSLPWSRNFGKNKKACAKAQQLKIMNNRHFEHFTDLHAQHKKKWESFKSLSFKIALARLAVFLMSVVCCYLIYKFQFTAYGYLLVLAFGVPLFLILVSKAQTIKESELLEEQLTLLNEFEVKVQKGDLSEFHNGEEHQLAGHPFALDMDLFGEKSIFQYLNRCSSVKGRKALADQLLFPFQDADKIRKRQAAVKELSELEEWRQNYWAQGQISHSESKLDVFLDWIEHGERISISSALNILLYILPAIFVILALAGIVGLLPIVFAITVFIFNLVIVGFYLKRINSVHQQVGKIAQDLTAQTELIKLVENQAFKSSELNALKSNLSSEGNTASSTIRRLSGILSSLDNRLNMLVGVFLNGAFLWDLQQIRRINDWTAQHAANVPGWFANLNTWEMVSSFANFHFLNPDSLFPQITESQSFELSGTGIGHPMLEENSRVCNDYEMTNWGMIDVVTGANMAGKSTFLRTIGLSMVMAMCGSSIIAKSFLIRPTRLFSSMRTVDSLADNSSYFFAELSRLRESMDLAEDGKGVFIILDEILKGTNSTDKRKGSAAFIKRLSQLNCSGMVATHDLELAVLEDELKGKVRNKCFEVEIINDDLEFDYRLRDGVCKTLNATFLLKKMDII